MDECARFDHCLTQDLQHTMNSRLLFPILRRQVAYQTRSITSDDAKCRLPQLWPDMEKRFRQKSNSNGKLQLVPESPPMGTSLKQASVLVLLICVDDRPSLVFTQRSAHLSQHAAQISFPGGHFDETHDDSLEDTAIREAKEELYGTDDIVHSYWKDLRILGSGTALPSIRGVPVYPIFASLLEERFSSTMITTMWPGNPSEVDTVFTVPVCDLLKSETTQALPASRFNPPFEYAPVFPTEHGTIWGLTAYILKPTLHQLLGPVLCAT